MSTRQPVLTRRQRRRVQAFVRVGVDRLSTRWGQIMAAAAESLQLTPLDAAKAIGVLDDCPPSNRRELRLAAMVHARSLDMLERNGVEYYGDVPIAAERAALVESFGESFLIEVRETGEHPDVAAVRIRYSEVNLYRLRAVLHDATQWCGKSDVWRRRYLGGHRHRSSSGRRFVRTSSRRPGKARPSSSGSISRASTPSSSKASASPNTQSDEPAAPSSAHPSLPRRRHSASSVAARSGLGGRL